MLSQQIVLDVSRTTAKTLHYVQGEKGRLIQFAFINSAIDPEAQLTLSGLTANIHLLKPDGTFTIAAMTINNDVASYTLTENDCCVGGSGVYDVSLEDASNVIYTGHGNYIGDCRAVNEDTINSVSMVYGVPFPDGFQEKLIAGTNISIVDNVISASSGGGGGTTDYNLLSNQPKINNVTLSGNKTSTALGLQSTLTFDASPVNGSTNPVTSNGIYSSLSNKVDTNKVGVSNGIAELDASGHVPSSQLPSYVDDVVEGYYDSNTDKFYEEQTYTTEIPGEVGKIYITLDTNLSYRWTGSGFVVISPSLALGETSSTAYRGDRGKIAYDTSLINATSIQTINTTLGSTSISGIGDGKVTGAISTLDTAIDSINTQIGITDISTIGDGKLTGAIYAVNEKTVPAGGSSGQVLAKTSGTDYDVTWITPSSGASSANAVTYDGTTSGLAATNVQDAIDEVDSDVDGIETAIGTTDISSVGDGTVTGAISTLNSSMQTQEISPSSTTSACAFIKIVKCGKLVSIFARANISSANTPTEIATLPSSIAPSAYYANTSATIASFAVSSNYLNFGVIDILLNDNKVRINGTSTGNVSGLIQYLTD